MWLLNVQVTLNQEDGLSRQAVALWEPSWLPLAAGLSHIGWISQGVLKLASNKGFVVGKYQPSE